MFLGENYSRLFKFTCETTECPMFVNHERQRNVNKGGQSEQEEVRCRCRSLNWVGLCANSGRVYCATRSETLTKPRLHRIWITNSRSI